MVQDAGDGTMSVLADDLGDPVADELVVSHSHARKIRHAAGSSTRTLHRPAEEPARHDGHPQQPKGARIQQQLLWLVPASWLGPGAWVGGAGFAAAWNGDSRAAAAGAAQVELPGTSEFIPGGQPVY